MAVEPKNHKNIDLDTDDPEIKIADLFELRAGISIAGAATSHLTGMLLNTEECPPEEYQELAHNLRCFLESVGRKVDSLIGRAIPF